MKYVKLTAKADTWFKEGTEVYTYGSEADNTVRVTLEEWEECNNFVCVVSGIRISSTLYEMKLFPEGAERWDGECCGCNEFEVEIVDDPC